MNITVATEQYEAWLAGHTPLYRPDLDYKHKQMAESFPFFRGTYYRWAQRWAKAAGDLADAPTVLAIGDLHVENFGTWRDLDGRLCWGVNDFDEADHLPYTNDLVRLACSVRFARAADGITVKFGAACKEILTGYTDALTNGGEPFVLEERNPELRALAMSKDRDPAPFWRKEKARLIEPSPELPEAARRALLSDLPMDRVKPTFHTRPRVGMGSLGKPRYVALAEWGGGLVAREAKAATPPATAWHSGRGQQEPHMAEVVRKAVRCPDPFYRLIPGWVVRRLGPRCSRLELTHLKQAADSDRVLRAMGAETANVHLGSAAHPAIQKDLSRRPKGWLEEAARSMGKLIEEDWNAWRAKK